MTRIDDIQRKNTQLRIKLEDNRTEIKALQKELDLLANDMKEYIKEMQIAYQRAFLIEKDHVFDKYEFHTASNAAQTREEIEIVEE